MRAVMGINRFYVKFKRIRKIIPGILILLKLKFFVFSLTLGCVENVMNTLDVLPLKNAHYPDSYLELQFPSL